MLGPGAPAATTPAAMAPAAESDETGGRPDQSSQLRIASTIAFAGAILLLPLQAYTVPPAIRQHLQLARDRRRPGGRLRPRTRSLPREPPSPAGRARSALGAPHLRAGGAAAPPVSRAPRRAGAVADSGLDLPLALRAEAPD